MRLEDMVREGVDVGFAEEIDFLLFFPRCGSLCERLN